MQYSFGKSLFKTILRLVIVATPLVLTLMPHTWQDLSIGGVLMLLMDWAKSQTTLA